MLKIISYKVVFLLMILGGGIIKSTSPAYAYTADWTKGKYTHFSKEEPLKEMLKAMASNQDIPIIISNKVTDVISVYFRDKSVKEILATLKSAYNLMLYFDGSVLYVYKSSETQSATVSLTKSSIFSLEEELIKIEALSLSNKNLKWIINKGDSNSASIQGPKRFIEIVFREAKKIEESLDIIFYKWTTQDGRIHYGNQPPFGTRFKKVMVVHPIIPMPTSPVQNVNTHRKVEEMQ